MLKHTQKIFSFTKLPVKLKNPKEKGGGGTDCVTDCAIVNVECSQKVPSCACALTHCGPLEATVS